MHSAILPEKKGLELPPRLSLDTESSTQNMGAAVSSEMFVCNRKTSRRGNLKKLNLIQLSKNKLVPKLPTSGIVL
jgi:hypothetical protein